MHTREEHILSVFVLILIPYYEIRIRLIGRSLFLTLINRCSFGKFIMRSVFRNSRLGGVSLSIKQRTVAILVAAEIVSEREDILRRVLVHRRIGRRTYHDDCVCRVTNHQHEHTQQHCVLYSCADDSFTAFRNAQDNPQTAKNHSSDEERAPSETIKRNTKHTHRRTESDVLAQCAFASISLIYRPYYNADEEYQIDYHARIEWHLECIDKEKLKPSTHSDNARNDAIEHRSNDNKRHGKRNERATEVGIGHFLIIIYQYDCRNTQQIEQVYTDTEACHICNEYQPTVAMRLVGAIFPFQDKPKHNGRECR